MNAVITTEQDRINAVSKEWDAAAAHYRDRGGYSPDQLAIGDRLRSLDLSSATADDIAKIIGNRSWTELYCNECGESARAVMTFGEEPDYGSKTVSLCESCIKEAAALFSEARGSKA